MAVRWTLRLLGLVNTIVLARLLTPADFGIVTIAMMIAGIIEVFSQTGQNLALIRIPFPTRDHYNSAWTVSVLLCLFLGSVIWFAAPMATIYFHEPRASSVVHVVALRTMLGGMANTGIINFKRDFRFRAQFAYDTVPSIVSFVTTLTAAIVLRNYWALVIGIMSQQISVVASSYILEPYRPWFSFKKIGEIWSFSIWTFLRSISVYLNGQIDKFAVGGFGGAATMGRYEVAMDLAISPTAEINAPMIGTLFPVMAKVQNDPEKRRELYLRVIYWSAIICTSTSVGVALISSDMVDLVLGHKWVDAKPLMPWLALAFGTLGLSSSVYSAYDVIGRPRTAAALQWTRLAGLTLCIVPVAYFMRSAHAIAITRFVVTLAITPTLFFQLARTLDITLRAFLLTLWRPFAASVAMAAAVYGVNSIISFAGPLRLATDVAVGAAAYGGFLLSVWNLLGRPEGPETLVWNWMDKAVRFARGGSQPVSNASPGPRATAVELKADHVVTAPLPDNQTRLSESIEGNVTGAE